MSADSAEVIESTEVESVEEESSDSGFDMDGATTSIANDLFNHGEHEEEVKEVEPKEVESDETTDEVESDESVSEEEETEEKRDAPASWKKEMRETWDSISPDAQEYIETRESQMKEGLETDRNDANLGRIMRDTMAPFADFLSKRGMDEATAVKNLMNIHYRMDNAPNDQKIELLHTLAASYGLKLNGEEQQEVDPSIKALQDEMQGMRSILNERQQSDLQSARDKVIQEVEVFASDEKHVYFEEIEGDIAQLITAGFSLEDAYEKAVWANPITRQKEMNRINEEKGAVQLEEARKKAEKSKKAKAANVKSRDTKYSPTEKKGTMEDTLHAVMKDIRSR